jgi:hypothetical protein
MVILEKESAIICCEVDLFLVVLHQQLNVRISAPGVVQVIRSVPLKEDEVEYLCVSLLTDIFPVIVPLCP